MRQKLAVCFWKSYRPWCLMLASIGTGHPEMQLPIFQENMGQGGEIRTSNLRERFIVLNGLAMLGCR